MWLASIQLALVAGLVREERAAWPDKTRTGTAQAWSTYENVRRASQSAGAIVFDSFARDEPTALCWSAAQSAAGSSRANGGACSRPLEVEGVGQR